MLRLEHLSVTGFRSIRSTVEFDVPSGAFLIEGDTASGKTSLFREALYWLLMGTNLRGESIDNVVNIESEKAEIVGTFNIQGVGHATATRWRTSSCTGGFKFVAEDGRDLLTSTGTANSWLHEPIERLLGMRAATVRAACFYHHNESIMTLKDTGRRELLEDAFGLDWIRSAGECFATAYASVATNQTNTKMSMAVLESEASLQARAADEFASQITAAKARIAAGTSDQLARLEAELASTTATYNSALESSQKASAEYSDLSARFKKASSSVDALRNEYNNLYYKRNMLAGKLSIVLDQKSKVESEYAAVVSGQRSVCPTCSRPFGDDHQKDLLDKLGARLSEIATQVDALANEMSSMDASIGPLSAALAVGGKLMTGVQTLANDVQAADKRSRDLSSATAQLSSMIFNVINPAITKLKAVRPDDDSTVLSLEKAREEALARAGTAAKALSEARERMSLLTAKLERLAWWKQAMGPKGIRAFVLEGLLPRLSSLASYYLGQMSGYQMSIEITPTRTTKQGKETENIDIRVHNLRGLDSYSDGSGGECRMADLAITLALYDMAVSQSGSGGLGYLLLDEALDVLNASKASDVVTALSALGDRGMSVGVISHSDAVRGNFTDIMQVERKPSGWTMLRHISNGVAGKLSGEPIVDDDLVPKARRDLNKRISDRFKELGATSKQKSATVRSVAKGKISVSSLTDVEAEKLNVILLSIDKLE